MTTQNPILELAVRSTSSKAEKRRERLIQEERTLVGEIYLLSQKEAGVDGSVQIAKFGFVVANDSGAESNLTIKDQRLLKEARLEEVRRLLKAYSDLSQEQVAIMTELESKGLAPIAIVSEEFFSALCKKYKLWRFEHLDDDGATNIKSHPYLFNGISFLIIASLFIFLFSVFTTTTATISATVGSLIAALIVTALMIGKDEKEEKPQIPSHTGTDGNGGPITAAVIGALIYYTCVYHATPLVGISNELAHHLLTVLAIVVSVLVLSAVIYGFGLFLALATPKALFLKLLWPKRRDMEENTFSLDKTGKTLVSFTAKTDEHFRESLQKVAAAQLHPMTAAVTQAISINRLQAIRAINLMSWSPIVSMPWCPILYTRHGEKKDQIAIHSHCGEFAAEQEVMKWVELSQ